MAYTRFFLMIATSTLLMFGLMYLNTYLVSHVFWSETRAYMALVMGAVMAFVMLAFMLGSIKTAPPTSRSLRAQSWSSLGRSGLSGARSRCRTGHS